MSAVYATLIYAVGAPVVINAEPCTSLGSGVYQITDALRRLLDPSVEISAYDDDDDSEVEIAEINYFTGTVTLADGVVIVGNVQVDAAYLTKELIGGSKAYNFELSGDIPEDTTFASAQASGGYKSRHYGLHDITVGIDRYDDLAHKFRNHRSARERVYIEVQPSGGPQALKGWFIVETASAAGDVGSLEEESLSFNLASIDGIQQDGKATVFSFS